MQAIDMKALTKNYGTSRGITDLSFQVPEGDFFGFIGPNGAGKSTTIRTLLGLLVPTSGEASVLGKNIRTQKTEILADIGYMPSEAMFYNNMRVKDVIALSANLYKKNCSKAAASLCERLALDTEKQIEALSLGNRKKVSIVCAAQHDPKLFILDEPTSGLDPLMQKEFFSILQEHHAKGATIFFSSHVLSEVQKNCKHAAIIKEGKLVALDTVENLSKTKSKRIILHGIQTMPESISGKSVKTENDCISFLYNGEIKALLAKISVLPITDISITDPDLEEIFLHYYEEVQS